MVCADFRDMHAVDEMFRAVVRGISNCYDDEDNDDIDDDSVNGGEVEDEAEDDDDSSMFDSSRASITTSAVVGPPSSLTTMTGHTLLWHVAAAPATPFISNLLCS